MLMMAGFPRHVTVLRCAERARHVLVMLSETAPSSRRRKLNITFEGTDLCNALDGSPPHCSVV